MSSIENQKKELEDQILVLEESLVELKAQLKKVEETQQHEAIDNLEKHLEFIDSKYDHVKLLWKAMGNELRQIFSKPDDNKDA